MPSSTKPAPGKQATLLGFFTRPAASTAPARNPSAPIASRHQAPAKVASEPLPAVKNSIDNSGSHTSPATRTRNTGKVHPAKAATSSEPLPSLLDTPPPTEHRDEKRKRSDVQQRYGRPRDNELAPPSSPPASSPSAGRSTSASRAPLQRLVSPSSSDPLAMDVDDDEDAMPVRRRSAAKRTISYAESDDDEDDDGHAKRGVESDSEQEAADAYSPSINRGKRGTARSQKRSRTERDLDAFIVSDQDDLSDDEELAAMVNGGRDDNDDSDEEMPLRSRASTSKGKQRASKPDTTPSRFSGLGSFKMGSAEETPSRPRPSPGSLATPTIARTAGGASLSHLTKAERRVIEEKKRKADNEQAYSFLIDLRDKDGNRPGDPDYDPRTVYIPPSAWKDFTPFEVQFWKIKQNHWDTVLFFQKGKFYELYEEDALIGHREFDLKLTDRVKMKMVGVPESSFDIFAAKFLALGYKVGRVDQTETAVAKGMRVGEKSRGGGSEIVNRELRHVLTSGTIVDASALPDDLNSYCVSIKEEAGPRFGVCTLDASTAEFNLAEFDDDESRSRLETLLRSLRLKEVLHEKAGLTQATSRVLRNVVPSSCQITMLKAGSEFLDSEATVARLEDLFGGSEPEHLPEGIASMLHRHSAMSALGAMLTYLAQLNLDRDLCSSRNFNIFDPLRRDQCLVLDAQSLTHLNVLQNDQGTDEGTLHRLLNRCVTPFGKRLFKIWMVAPLAEIESIRARQDAVDEFLNCPTFGESFDAFAKPLPDIERIVPRIYAGKCRPRDFTRVVSAFGGYGEAVERLLSLAEAFGNGGGVVGGLLRSIPDVTTLADELKTKFQLAEDGSFTPKRDVFGPFDEAEEALTAIENQLEDELNVYRKQLKLNASKCGWKHLGTRDIYQIEVPATTKVPANWVKLSGTKDRHRFYSPAVRDLVQELKEARETRLAALKQFHSSLFAEFVEQSVHYMQAVKAIAEIDCLLSLAKASYAIGEPTCRPELVEHETALVDFEELRHPCIAEGVDFIPNSVQLGGEHDEVVVLTGGNMAGKSTTARTTATAVIIAQLGCRVPASRARLSPVDRIASRMGANDQIFRNNSTFMVEMLEASRIVKECTPRSLVVMDELGRGTSTFDGQAIAFAVLHHLVSRTRCLTFFLTHYTNLAYDFERYPRVSNKHMQVLVDDDRREVIFTYRLIDGIAESSYGTQVAALAGVPHQICDRAAVVSKQFMASTQWQLERREQSKIPIATLSDFAHLFKVAGEAVSTHASPQKQAESQRSRARAIASQLEVIREQVKSLDQQRSPSRNGGDAATAAAASASSVGAAGAATAAAATISAESPSDAASGARSFLTEPIDIGATVLRQRSSKTTYAGRPRRMRTEEPSFPSCSGEPASVPTTPTKKRQRRDLDGTDGDELPKRSLSSPVTSRTSQLFFPGKAKRTVPSMSGAADASASRRSEQLILDLGQRIRVVCKDCGMQYDTSSPEDCTLHTKYHDRTIKGVDWSSKSLLAAGKEVERCQLRSRGAPLKPSVGSGASNDDEVRILCYELGHVREAVATRKLGELMASIDEALGASALPSSTTKACQLFVAVKGGRGVGAALVGRVPLGSARRVVGAPRPDDKENHGVVGLPAQGATQVLQDGGDAIFVSDPLPASTTPPIGIYRIHVVARYRRSGLASRLLDAAADHSVYGLNLDKLQRTYGGRAGTVAFSQPTEAGRKLAERWIRGGAETQPDPLAHGKRSDDGRLVVFEA